MHSEIKTFHLAEPFRIAHGASATRQVLRLTEGPRTSEAPFVPYYGENPQETLALLNQPVLPEHLPQTARLALNLLRHDTIGHATAQPLWKVAEKRLGAPKHPAPPGCRSFGIPDDLDVFAGKVEAAARQFQVLKLKLGSGDLGLDLATVSVARYAAPEAKLLLDVNGGWDLIEAAHMIPKVAEYEPALIEQPIHHRLGMAGWEELRAQLPAQVPPLFADESTHHAANVEAIASLVDGVNVKLLKCGSLEAAMAMIAAAREHNLEVLLGCMIESSLGTTAAAHLAGWADWIDLDGHLYLLDDDFTGIEYDAAGRLIMPDGPGIGARPR